MALPKRIIIHELGPREGMQIEKTPIATSEKIRLVDLLSDCVFPEIEVTSFVSPSGCRRWPTPSRWSPESSACRHGLQVRLAQQRRAWRAPSARGKLDVEGSLSVTASETFSKKNTNRTIDETFAEPSGGSKRCSR